MSIIRNDERVDLIDASAFKFLYVVCGSHLLYNNNMICVLLAIADSQEVRIYKQIISRYWTLLIILKAHLKISLELFFKAIKQELLQQVG